MSKLIIMPIFLILIHQRAHRLYGNIRRTFSFPQTLLSGSIAYSIIIIKGRYMGLSLKM